MYRVLPIKHPELLVVQAGTCFYETNQEIFVLLVNKLIYTDFNIMLVTGSSSTSFLK